ncbi:phytoene desaturase family protein [Streptomyces sp. NPDC058657]|uniref:phytoene desaturase family protein n=1 Tax=unclassified Streptomyces TaxID=2593676 RepID=UPI0036460135
MARIVVIGAGLGAMATAARLAVAGHRVTVYERGRTYGGSAGRFERDGFGFDTGPDLVHLPAVYRDVFVKTGKEPLEALVDIAQVDPAVRHFFPDGTTVSLPNASRGGVVAALEEALGTGLGERWGEFMNRARDAWDRTRRPLLEEPLRADWQVLGRDPYPSVPVKRLLRRTRRAGTLAEVAAWELADPRLAALLESYALAYGLDPRDAPASAAVLPYLEQTFGSWYVAGGTRELARALYERCVARRVEFVFGAQVASVVEKDGRAVGVELADGTLAEADSVVAAVPPERLSALLGGRSAYGSQDAPPRGAAPVGVAGRVRVFLALDGAREAGAVHRSVVHAAHREGRLAEVFDGAGPTGTSGAGGPGAGATGAESPNPESAPTVWVSRPDDPALRPGEGHEAVVLTATAPARPGYDWLAPGVAERWADRMVAAAAAAVPGLAERIRWREIRTPADTAEVTGAGAGAVPAPALAGRDGRFLAPSNTTSLDGLYAAGGWAHPGGGVAHAGMSGALVAGLIVEGEGFRGSQ